MNLPEPLLRDKDFMRLRLGVCWDMWVAERDNLDSLIALAFMRGETLGMAKAREYMQAKTDSLAAELAARISGSSHEL